MRYAFLLCAIGVLTFGSADYALADMDNYLGMLSLQQSQGQIAVRFDSLTVIDWDAVFADYEFLSTDVPPRPIIDDFYILNLEQTTTPDSAIAIMIWDERFTFVNPVLVDSYGHHIYMTTRVYLEVRAEYFFEIEALADQYGAVVIDTLFASRNGIVTELPSGKSFNPLTLGYQFMIDSTVVKAIPDFVIPFKPLFEPSDQYYINQYHLSNLDMPLAWEVTIPPTPLIVAILDDGTEWHEDMDESRWADGYDYINYTGDESPPSSCTYCYHAMAVAGIIGASTDNDSMGVASIAGREGVQIMGQEIFNELSPSMDIWASEYGIADAIRMAVYDGALVINNSWGIWPTDLSGFLFDVIDNAIDDANDSGVFVVCGSGNWCFDIPAACNSLAYPASHPSTFAVGALGQGDTIASFSQGGDGLDVVGYGESIYTIDRMFGGYNKQRGAPCTTDEYSCDFGGTSAASPQVAAIAALVLQRRPDLQRNLDILKMILRYSCENPYSPVEDTARINNSVGWGRVNAFRALLSVCRGDVNNSGDITFADPTYLINYIFKNGPPPELDVLVGDADCSGDINTGDAVYLINYISKGGPPPVVCFKY